MRQCTSILLGPGLILVLVHAGEINGEEGSQCARPFSLWVVVHVSGSINKTGHVSVRGVLGMSVCVV